MASALKPTSDAWNADGTPRIFGDVFAVDAAEVDASQRLRPVDAAWAAALGQIMLSEGQLTPIQVSRNRGKGKPWILVAGGHRHAAGEMFLDLNPLRAIEVEGGALARRQAEIAENLHRRDLGPIDRASFIAELHDVLRARSGLDTSLSPQQIAVNARWQKELKKEASDTSATIAHVYGFTDELVESVGLSRRAVQYDLMLARRLSPAVTERLRGLPIAGNATQLRALAKLDAAEQMAVVEQLLGGAKSVSDALSRIQNKPKPTPEDKNLSAFLGSFDRMSLSEKKGALHQLAGMLPAGFTLDMGEE